jgi:hypothetical protein
MLLNKTLLFKLISPFEKIFSIKGLIKLSGNNLILPLYHSVDEKIPPHLQYLNEVRNKNEFIRDIDILLKIYRPIDLFELIDINQNDKHLDKPCFHLTFDGGLRSFYDTIAPLLQEKGVPATCFLNSEFIDNYALNFRHKISLIIQKLHHEKSGSNHWKNYHIWQKQHGFANRYYQAQLLSLQFNQCEIIDELASILEMNFLNYLQDNKPYLNKEQIEYLITKGFTFGANNLDNSDFRFIREEYQLQQTSENMKLIIAGFNLNYRVFSFPINDCDISSSFFNTVYNENILDLSFGCAGIRKDTITKNLQRIPVEENNKSLREILKNEYLKYCLLKIVGKHEIIRN